MKKIISLIIVALLIGMVTVAYAAKGPATPGIGDVLGAGQFPSDPHRIFRLVRYVPQSTAAALVEGTLTADSIVIWDRTSDDGVTVTTTSTSYDSGVAGIMVTAVATPDYSAQGNTAVEDTGRRNWGFLQTYGLCEVTIQTDSGTVTAGDAMATGSRPGQACDFLASATVSTAQGNAGFFYDTQSAGDTDAECFVRLD